MSRLIPLVLLVLSACYGASDKGTDTSDPTGTDSGVGGEGGFCDARAVFSTRCVACHSASSAAGGLDLQTDAHAALVGVASSLYAGRTLVVAGDPDGSFLHAKVTATQAAGEGSVMPPSGVLDAAEIEILRAWIADGATEECGAPDSGTDTDGYHPAGWDDPTQHGMAAKHQEDVCTSCHGADLNGVDAAVSCDTCHTPSEPDAWRTDCTFCHGGVDNLTGAPPEGISDETDAAETSFPPHTTHVEETTLKSAFDCVQCHTKPTDIFSPGHIFVGDTTPGVADLRFVAGLSPATTWNGDNGTCSNLYCHGNGRGNNGTVTVDSDVTCGSCHAVRTSGESGWDRMSEPHEDHLEEGVQCWECHGDTVDSRDQIVDKTLHVDGDVDLKLVSTMSRVGDTCTGSCHGEGHSGRRWADD